MRPEPSSWIVGLFGVALVAACAGCASEAEPSLLGPTPTPSAPAAAEAGTASDCSVPAWASNA